MIFEIKGKVALISGGASGIGLWFARELLRNGLKGVTLADINNDLGEKAVEEIQNEFGTNKAIYVQTDVTSKESFEGAFKKTIEEFKNLDILINNAGILNDAIWQKEIAINVKKPKYKTDTEGVIVNISSITGLKESGVVPVYTGTKFAVTGISKAFGHEAHYKRTQVRVLALCPGVTDTPLISEMSGRNFGGPYQELLLQQINVFSSQQKPESVALAMVKIIQNAKTGTVWVAEDGQDPYEFISPPRRNFAPK